MERAPVGWLYNTHTRLVRREREREAERLESIQLNVVGGWVWGEERERET